MRTAEARNSALKKQKNKQLPPKKKQKKPPKFKIYLEISSYK